MIFFKFNNNYNGYMIFSIYFVLFKLYACENIDLTVIINVFHILMKIMYHISNILEELLRILWFVYRNTINIEKK